MNKNRFRYLLQQFASGHLNPEEERELHALFAQYEREQLVDEVAELAGQEQDLPQISTGQEAATTFARIVASDKPQQTHKQTSPRIIRMRRMAAAAILLIVLPAAMYFMLRPDGKPVVADRPVEPTTVEKDPGRNSAVLTLADETQVTLDSLGNGLIAQQGGSRVLMANGELAYQAAGQGEEDPIARHKITTPRGGEFALTLADGTRVWLNAASSLTFPTRFTGGERQVELTGEAYFDVAEDRNHPFKVKVRGVEISVLGTELNIMAYDDEPRMITTLVSGSLRIASPGNTSQLLAPGEHAVIENANGKIFIEIADVEEETAWKNGRIHFNGANIQRIMRQVSRWYNVDVEYRGNTVNMDFTCTVSRRDRLSKLLKLLELTGAVHFTMEENKIIVHP